ncbi:MAG: hypothetical protein JW833_10255 [Prolixibacteraceae bacterium]|nr:hypothetical protein [Prolixibacteraceae bacterium]
MNQKTLFREIEKTSFHLHFKDGMFELLFGSMFISFVINSFMDNSGYVSPLFIRLLIIPVAIILALLKLLITQPRIGSVKYSEPRRNKQKWVLITAISAQVITFILYYLSVKGIIHTETKSRFTSLLIEFMFLILVFGLISYNTSYSLFFIVGVVYAFGVPFTIFLEPWIHTRNYGYGFIAIAGIIILITGIIKLLSFLKKYPKTVTDGK